MCPKLQGCKSNVVKPPVRLERYPPPYKLELWQARRPPRKRKLLHGHDCVSFVMCNAACNTAASCNRSSANWKTSAYGLGKLLLVGTARNSLPDSTRMGFGIWPMLHSSLARGFPTKVGSGLPAPGSQKWTEWLLVKAQTHPILGSAAPA